MKRKIICPNDTAHIKRGYEKILMAYEEETAPDGRLWIHCDDRVCNTWYQIDFHNSSPILTPMPKNYHFDFIKTPTLVKDS